ncbi:MAG TPA: hypothetical protein VFQ92_04295 [Blastocatellia bacterium]|nr:hypothetical protein [Blastocatellia bacterium]
MRKKKSKRQSKPRAKAGRKQKPEPQRTTPMLASEAGLRCRQYRQIRPGKFEACQAAAVGYVPGIGDSCDSPRVKPQVRYATTREAVTNRAA